MPKGQYYSGLLTDNESVQSDYLGGMLDEPPPEELQAMGGGLSRYLLADIPGGLVDTAAQGLSYGAEGFKNLLPEDLSGYDLSKILVWMHSRKVCRTQLVGVSHLRDSGNH